VTAECVSLNVTRKRRGGRLEGRKGRGQEGTSMVADYEGREASVLGVREDNSGQIA